MNNYSAWEIEKTPRSDRSLQKKKVLKSKKGTSSKKAALVKSASKSSFFENWGATPRVAGPGLISSVWPSAFYSAGEVDSMKDPDHPDSSAAATATAAANVPDDADDQEVMMTNANINKKDIGKPLSRGSISPAPFVIPSPELGFREALNNINKKSLADAERQSGPSYPQVRRRRPPSVTSTIPFTNHNRSVRPVPNRVQYGNKFYIPTDPDGGKLLMEPPPAEPAAMAEVPQDDAFADTSSLVSLFLNSPSRSLFAEGTDSSLASDSVVTGLYSPSEAVKQLRMMQSMMKKSRSTALLRSSYESSENAYDYNLQSSQYNRKGGRNDGEMYVCNKLFTDDKLKDKLSHRVKSTSIKGIAKLSLFRGGNTSLDKTGCGKYGIVEQPHKDAMYNMYKLEGQAEGKKRGNVLDAAKMDKWGIDKLAHDKRIEDAIYEKKRKKRKENRGGIVDLGEMRESGLSRLGWERMIRKKTHISAAAASAAK